MQSFHAHQLKFMSTVKKNQLSMPIKSTSIKKYTGDIFNRLIRRLENYRWQTQFSFTCFLYSNCSTKLRQISLKILEKIVFCFFLTKMLLKTQKKECSRAVWRISRNKNNLVQFLLTSFNDESIPGLSFMVMYKKMKVMPSTIKTNGCHEIHKESIKWSCLKLAWP